MQTPFSHQAYEKKNTKSHAHAARTHSIVEILNIFLFVAHLVDDVTLCRFGYYWIEWNGICINCCVYAISIGSQQHSQSSHGRSKTFFLARLFAPAYRNSPSYIWFFSSSFYYIHVTFTCFWVIARSKCTSRCQIAILQEKEPIEIADTQPYKMAECRRVYTLSEFTLVASRPNKDRYTSNGHATWNEKIIVIFVLLCTWMFSFKFNLFIQSVSVKVDFFLVSDVSWSMHCS